MAVGRHSGDLMCRDQHRRSALGQGCKDPLKSGKTLRIQTGIGLIQKNEICPLAENTAQRETLLHACGKARKRIVLPPVKADEFDDLGGSHPPCPPGKFEVFPGGEFSVTKMPMIQEADLLADLMPLVYRIEPEDSNRAGIRPTDGGKHTQ